MSTSRWKTFLLVCAGGTVGTALRAGLALLWPTSGLPWATVAVNLLGAYLLGWLLAWLNRTDRWDRPVLRLGFGTGALGGFTTYSAWMVGVIQLPSPLNLGYALGMVVLGLIAARIGMARGERKPR